MILAAVSINLVLGDNGIITRAKDAKENTNTALQEENIEIDNLKDDMEKQLIEDPTEMQIVVNSGNNGVVIIPILKGEENDYIIDLGDGEKTKELGKRVPFHLYANINEEYLVKIKGKVTKFDTYEVGSQYEDEWGFDIYEEDYLLKIIKIKQWGELGAENLRFAFCGNLVEVASPTEKIFENAKDIEGLFF